MKRTCDGSTTPAAAEFAIVDSRGGERYGAERILKLSRSLVSDVELGAGDVIAVSIRNRASAFAWLLGLGLHDLVILPLDPDASDTQRSAYLRHAGARFVLTDEPAVRSDPFGGCRVIETSSLEAERGRARATPQDDGANGPLELTALRGRYLFYTSGSTGSPKGILLASEQLRANVALAIRHLPHRAGQRTASLLPAFHTFSFVNDLLVALALNGECVVLPQFRIQDLGAIVEGILQARVHTFSGVPLIFRTLMALGKALQRSDLEFVTSGAAPLGPALLEGYQKSFSHRLLPCYGLTEGVCFVAISTPDDVVPGAAGRPVVELRVHEPNDAGLGEIQIRGASVISCGYHQNAAASRELYTRDGWLRTGDLGYLDDRGLLFVRGRLKNMCIRGGEKVYLEDVEALFPPGACAGRTESEAESEEQFFLYYDSTLLSEREILSRVRSHLSERHVPDRLIPVAKIPTSPTGKLLRQRLHALDPTLATEGGQS